MFGIILAIVISSLKVQASTLRIAVCQILIIDSDREGNLRRVENALAVAQHEGAQLASFPESSILGWENPAAHQLACPIPGEDSDRIAALARKYRIATAIGLDEKIGDKLYDAVIVMDASGRLLAHQRKVNTRPGLMTPPYESGQVSEIQVSETPFGRMALLICADTFRADCVSRIADLKPDFVLVPYGWAAPLDEWPQHGRKLAELVARCARTWHAPTVGINCVGQISQGLWQGRTYGGASPVVDATGANLVTLLDRDCEVRVLDLPVSREK
jgi:predicted amidohydrolase